MGTWSAGVRPSRGAGLQACEAELEVTLLSPPGPDLRGCAGCPSKMGTPTTASLLEPRIIPAGQDSPQPVATVTGTSAVRNHREAEGMHPF